jgi:hypothetical protein
MAVLVSHLGIAHRVADPESPMDPNYFGKMDPDPHYSEKLDPDPHQSQSQIQELYRRKMEL